jgi:hypothetical protein
VNGFPGRIAICQRSTVPPSAWKACFTKSYSPTETRHW